MINVMAQGGERWYGVCDDHDRSLVREREMKMRMIQQKNVALELTTTTSSVGYSRISDFKKDMPGGIQRASGGRCRCPQE